MIAALLKDDAFLADVALHRNGPSLWWLGQSGWLVMHQGEGLLIDPYLSDSLTRKYAGTAKPHVRMSERVADPGRLRDIVAVTSSHNHTDHLDAETIWPVFAANNGMKLIVAEENRAFAAERLKCPLEWPVGLRHGEETAVGSFWFRAVPAAHEELSPAYMGLLIRFGGITLYHPGDCVPFEGLAGHLAGSSIDIALLPINGRLPERGVAGNFWGREAAALARQIGARLAVPMHYDMFEFNTVTPDEFAECCRELAQPFKILRAGERLDVSGR